MHPLGKEPLVTIVVPTRSREQLLRHALQSVVAQDYDNWEAIVVNDGGQSIESTVARLDPRCRIQCVEHFTSFGPATARNSALRTARGDIICYLDDDDVYLKHHVSTIVNAMQETQAPFVYTRCENVTESIEGTERRVHDRGQLSHWNKDFSREELHVLNYIPINTWGHRRDCLLKSGLFDETLRSHEDWELLLRLARFYEFRHLPILTTEVRVRQDSTDSVTGRAIHKFDMYRLIYGRYRELSTNSSVRRGRRRRLAVLAEYERVHFPDAGLGRTISLYWSQAAGGMLRVQRVLRQYGLWRGTLRAFGVIGNALSGRRKERRRG